MFGLFEKKKPFVGIDIGAHGIKALQLKRVKDQFIIDKIGAVSFNQDIFSQNTISKPEYVSGKLMELIAECEIKDAEYVTAVPSPSVFTKRVKVPQLSIEELREHIEFEAANYIPHGTESVHLDFHIVGIASKSQYEVIIIAVKNEIVESFEEVFALSGLKLSVLDIDQFAFQNSFEKNYPEKISSTVALLNIGHRYSGINICRDGQSLFSGDIPVGGRQLIDAIAEAKSIDKIQAENLLHNSASDPDIKEEIESMTSELSRQISYFWNAAGAQGGIDLIALSGGVSVLSGLLNCLTEETATECMLLDPFKNLNFSPTLDSEKWQLLQRHFAVALGLALRQTGDKIIPE
jgi:type IV pilus assembly protein PilM